MKGRLWWSSVLPLAATLCLTFAAGNVAQAQSGPSITGSGPEGPFSYSPRSSARRPGLIDPTCGLVGGPAVASSACDSQEGREWEGIASTDYFTFEPSVYSPPNPDIAVGPDDILTVVNRTIARYPNPNAPRFDNSGGRGPASVTIGGVTYSPTQANGYYFPPTSRQFLDVWLGEAALNELCPTFPRSNTSCEISNASVRYDQMQGRFLVLFTVVDTGLVACAGCAGTPGQVGSPARRKASWILIASRWATGCQGTGGGFASACVPNTSPAVPTSGIPGNTEFFTTPQPPGPSQGNPNSGGINSNWIGYGWGGDGTCASTVAGCAYGNINAISDVRRRVTVPGALAIDCDTSVALDSTRVCYFPSGARLGLDNDNIVITSSVYNDNWALANRSVGTPAWLGTRIRVFKKAAVYTGGTSTPGCPAGLGTLCPGASQASPQLQGDFYDLWGDSTTPYSVDHTVTRVLPDGSQQLMFGLHYEPEHVRGRSLATYNGNGNLDGQWSAIWGAVDQASGTANPQTLLYHRAITYTATVAGTIGANLLSTTPVVNTPLIMGGIPTLGILRSHTVPGFTNPQSVFQRAKLTQPSPNVVLPTPFLYVGDNRPHRVISREGHRYIARVGTMADLFRFDVPTMNSTVIYDIVQKLGPAAAATEIYNTSWGNGRYYAPMFDTPANVVQYGSVSPVQVLPFLEKLFVGTTFPPLSPSDPRLFNFGNIAQQALVACKGLEPGVASTAAAAAYPGLFDMRCGEDAYDTAQAYRHPITGGFTPADFQLQRQPSGFPDQIVPFGIYGGAATDPNNMGLWLYGAYAKGRLASIPGFGQWGTYVAHYPLTFPIRDVYNNLISGYTDVPPGHPFYTFIQIARQTEIEPGSRTATTFNVNGLAIRGEMARWVIRAQMDEPAITAYLNATGGIYCSFADVACPGVSGTVTDATGVTGNWRYIETMYRRGYTKGCDVSNDGQRRFCPTRNITRGEMAVFIIRAKMNSVFPTVVSGAFTTSSCVPPGTLVTQVGDQFGLFVGCSPYFSDVPNTHVFFAFIQKLRELRITNGTSLSTPTALGTFSPDANITRGELMTFVVRGFFP